MTTRRNLQVCQTPATPTAPSSRIMISTRPRLGFNLLLSLLGAVAFSQPVLAFSLLPHQPARVKATMIDTCSPSTPWDLGSDSAKRRSTSSIFSSSAESPNSNEDDDSQEEQQTRQQQNKKSLRSAIRQVTGFSFTAVRATLRAATGVSLTAIYASTLAVTGQWIRTVMKVILGAVPAPLRSFLQPFLVLYYAPLFIIRNLTGPTRQHAKQVHANVIEGWKNAVQAADEKATDGHWPLHLDQDGYFEKDFAGVNVNDAVAESVEIAMDTKNDDTSSGKK